MLLTFTSSPCSLWHRLCWEWCGIWPAVDAAMTMNLMTEPCWSSFHVYTASKATLVSCEQ